MQNTNNIAATYDYYTLDQARQIIAEENRQKEIKKSEEKRQKLTEIICYIKQKILGLIMLIVGIIIPIVLEGDATASVIIVPFGTWFS